MNLLFKKRKEQEKTMRQSSLLFDEVMTMYLDPQALHELEIGPLSFMHS